MLNAEDINRIIGIKEEYELPEKLLAELLNNNEKIFDEFLQLESDLSFDWFTNYFQENHSNRKAMMQDFTPDGITKLLGEICKEPESVADICAGTGGLTIGIWNKYPNIKVYAEELSKRAVPLLLFNLMIRNIEATVVNCDTLSRNTEAVYKITKSEKYGRLEITSEYELPKADLVITNPPYSLKYNFDDFADDERFKGYGLPPSNAADYGFILHGLSLLKNGGQVLGVLPHGVLFRGGKEKTIRENLAKKNINAIISLPDKLFLNTQIPVMILVLDKDRSNDNILFINGEKEFKKGRKNNVLTEENITKISKAYKDRREREKFVHITGLSELEENEYNLNIPRYVDTYEEKEEVNLEELIDGLNVLSDDIQAMVKETVDEMKQLECKTDEKVFKAFIEKFESLHNEMKALPDMNGIPEEIPMKSARVARIDEVTAIERAVKDKIYPAGTVYLRLSASDKILRQLKADGKIDNGNAAFIPKIQSNSKYL